MLDDHQFYIRAPKYVEDDEPFKNDLFERKVLADRLTKYIDGLNAGCVIGIDLIGAPVKMNVRRHQKVANSLHPRPQPLT